MDDEAPTIRPQRTVPVGRYVNSVAPPVNADDVQARLRVQQRRIDDLERGVDIRATGRPRNPHSTLYALLGGVAAIVAAGGGFTACSSMVRELQKPPEVTRADLDALKEELKALKGYLAAKQDAETPRWQFTESALCKQGYRDTLTNCDAVNWEPRPLPAGNKLKLAPEWRSRDYWKQLPPAPR